MDNQETTYTLTVKIQNIIRFSSESDSEYEQRVLEEGKKRARYYLSGYLKDPNNEVVFETVSINKN